jgi:hypothetical protein
MTNATSFGCDNIATWLEPTLTTVAPIRFAIVRSSSGWIARSSVATARSTPVSAG